MRSVCGLCAACVRRVCGESWVCILALPLKIDDSEEEDEDSQIMQPMYEDILLNTVSNLEQ